MNSIVTHQPHHKANRSDFPDREHMYHLWCVEDDLDWLNINVSTLDSWTWNRQRTVVSILSFFDWVGGVAVWWIIDGSVGMRIV